jgi:hypothetical protein
MNGICRLTVTVSNLLINRSVPLIKRRGSAFMNKASAMCGLLLFASAAFAGPQDIYGQYSNPSGVRIFTTEAACKDDGGQLAELDSSNQTNAEGERIAACYFRSEDGNDIDVIENYGNGQGLVQIRTVYGAARAASFTGVIYYRTYDSVTAREVNLTGMSEDIGSLVENGCRLKVITEKDGTVSTILGKNCDEALNLSHVKKKKQFSQGSTTRRL